MTGPDRTGTVAFDPEICTGKEREGTAEWRCLPARPGMVYRAVPRLARGRGQMRAEVMVSGD